MRRGHVKYNQTLDIAAAGSRILPSLGRVERVQTQKRSRQVLGELHGVVAQHSGFTPLSSSCSISFPDSRISGSRIEPVTDRGGRNQLDRGIGRASAEALLESRSVEAR